MYCWTCPFQCCVTVLSTHEQPQWKSLYFDAKTKGHCSTITNSCNARQNLAFTVNISSSLSHLWRERLISSSKITAGPYCRACARAHDANADVNNVKPQRLLASRFSSFALVWLLFSGLCEEKKKWKLFMDCVYSYLFTCCFMSCPLLYALVIYCTML